MGLISLLYRGETRIGFIASRKRWYLASLILIVICVLSIAIRGFNYGVEFAGGSEFRLQVTGTSITTNDVDTAFTDAGTTPANPPQQVGSGKTRSIVVQTKTISPQTQQKLIQDVSKKINLSTTKFNPTSVSSSWGHDISVKAIEGLVIFLIAVSIYISIRFQWRMAVGGIVALLHDLLVAAGIYSIVGFEVTPRSMSKSAWL